MSYFDKPRYTITIKGRVINVGVIGVVVGVILVWAAIYAGYEWLVMGYD